MGLLVCRAAGQAAPSFVQSQDLFTDGASKCRTSLKFLSKRIASKKETVTCRSTRTSLAETVSECWMRMCYLCQYQLSA